MYVKNRSRILKLCAVIPFVAALVSGQPAMATSGGGAGTVTGDVTLSPGYGTSTLTTPQAFTFNSVQITGVFAAATPAQDCVTTNLNAAGVTGNSTLAVSSVAVDAGHVNGFTATDNVCVSVIVTGCTFVRVGGIVVVVCTAAECVIGPDGISCDIYLVALFNPSGTSLPLTNFNLRGSYVS